jgi:hypothetical protein
LICLASASAARESKMRRSSSAQRNPAARSDQSTLDDRDRRLGRVALLVLDDTRSMAERDAELSDHR